MTQQATALEECLTVSEVADHLKLHPEVVRKKAHDGEFGVGVFRVGKGLRIPVSGVAEYKERRRIRS